VEAAVVG
jgi:hypothetical protein